MCHLLLCFFISLQCPSTMPSCIRQPTMGWNPMNSESNKPCLYNFEEARYFVLPMGKVTKPPPKSPLCHLWINTISLNTFHKQIQEREKNQQQRWKKATFSARNNLVNSFESNSESRLGWQKTAWHTAHLFESSRSNQGREIWHRMDCATIWRGTRHILLNQIRSA